MKQRHQEIASGKNRVKFVIQEGKNLNTFPSRREKFFREKGVNNFRAEMIDCQSSPGDHGTLITRGLALDGKSFHSFQELRAGTRAEERHMFLVAGGPISRVLPGWFWGFSQ